ncbi:MAG: 50S ribosomal protein L37ae [Candidatus Bathyarchaeia archaeon]
MRKTSSNPVRGYGARYGGTVRKRYIEILNILKRKHRCNNCGSVSIVRKSAGVWTCRKCGLTFTGGAYSPSTKLGTIASRISRRT